MAVAVSANSKEATQERFFRVSMSHLCSCPPWLSFIFFRLFCMLPLQLRGVLSFTSHSLFLSLRLSLCLCLFGIPKCSLYFSLLLLSRFFFSLSHFLDHVSFHSFFLCPTTTTTVHYGARCYIIVNNLGDTKKGTITKLHRKTSRKITDERRGRKEGGGQSKG